MVLSKRRLVLVALAIVAIAMSGCKVRQTVAFNDDGSGTFSYLVGIEKDVLADLGVDDPYERIKQQVEEGDFPVELERYESGDLTGFRLSFEFTDVDDLKDKLNIGDEAGGSGQQTLQALSVDRTGDRWVLSGAIGSPGLASGEELPIDLSKLEEKLDMRFSVSLPGRPATSNAVEVREGESETTFEWVLSPGESGREISAVTDLPKAFPTLLVVGAGLGALLIGGGAWMFMRRRSATPVLEEQPEASHA